MSLRMRSLRSFFRISPANAVLVLLALLALTYIIVRAATLSFTVDESGTWRLFIHKSNFFPTHFDANSANNHLLNTWLMFIAHHFFGSSELAIRLPNVLAGALYLFCVIMLVQPVKAGVWRVAAFLLLAANPYLLQYFSLARGYGLSIALMTAALWQGLRYISEGQHLRTLLAAVLLAAGAVLANLTLLHFFLPFVFLLFACGWLLVRKQYKRLWLYFPHASTLFAGSVLLFAIVLPQAMGMRNAHALYFGGRYFWTHMIASLVKTFGYDAVDAPVVAVAAWILLPSGMLLLLVLAVKKYRAEKYGSLLHSPFMFVLALFLLALASTVMQRVLFGTLFPIYRTALFFVPLFFLAFVYAVQSLNGAVILQRLLLPVAGGAMLLHFLLAMNVYSTYEWKFDADTKSVVQLMERYHACLEPEERRIRIGLGSDFVAGFLLYRNLQGHDFDIASSGAEAANPLNDFCFLPAYEVQRAGAKEWEVLYRFPETGNVLFARRRSLPSPEFREEVKRSQAFANSPPTHCLDNVQHYSEEFRWSWESKETEEKNHALVKVGADVRFDDFRSDLWLGVSCKRNGESYFLKYIDLQELAETTHEWQRVDYSIVLPSLHPGDEVAVWASHELGPPVQLEDIRATISMFAFNR